MMHDILNFREYKSILCLDSDLPNLAFFKDKNLPIIAADGAANRLLNLGLSPDLILGDLDSVDAKILARHPFLKFPDQNSNDYQKAMVYLQEQDLLPAIVVGINNGCLDHVLNNINIFMETACLLYAPPIKGFVLKSQLRMVLPKNSKISLMGIPEATVSTEGLKWDLKQDSLSFPGKTSCFNRTKDAEIFLQVHQGALLVLVYEALIDDASLSI